MSTLEERVSGLESKFDDIVSILRSHSKSIEHIRKDTENIFKWHDDLAECAKNIKKEEYPCLI